MSTCDTTASVVQVRVLEEGHSPFRSPETVPVTMLEALDSGMTRGQKVSRILLLAGFILALALEPTSSSS